MHYSHLSHNAPVLLLQNHVLCVQIVAVRSKPERQTESQTNGQCLSVGVVFRAVVGDIKDVAGLAECITLQTSFVGVAYGTPPLWN
ncbi:hypothetical protein AGOR_G00017140 [Albula goreensis]|uniref:Uncharacterized protein n=1 Tax=Albula goreensis TaxID=1534307 RepID=A0A8T3DZT1_9TELE|nr:hypothetical protein AGOR_G00017140 [Albula goreensis]